MTELARIEERLGKLAPQLFHLAHDMAASASIADAADLEALSSPGLSRDRATPEGSVGAGRRRGQLSRHVRCAGCSPWRGKPRRGRAS